MVKVDEINITIYFLLPFSHSSRVHRSSTARHSLSQGCSPDRSERVEDQGPKPSRKWNRKILSEVQYFLETFSQPLQGPFPFLGSLPYSSVPSLSLGSLPFLSLGSLPFPSVPSLPQGPSPSLLFSPFPSLGSLPFSSVPSLLFGPFPNISSESLNNQNCQSYNENNEITISSETNL